MERQELTGISIPRLLGTVLGLAALAAVPAHALTTYTGSLGYPGEVAATGRWANANTTLSWVVSLNPTGSWHYDYTFNHNDGMTSHIIIEISKSLTSMDDFIVWGGNFGSDPIIGDWGTEGNSNPFIPETLHGIKVNRESPTGGTNLWFDCWRVPVWGDFYAKDGGNNPEDTAFNLGFTGNPQTPGLDDWDPVVAPHNDPEADHLLVPDSRGNPIPEPGTILLLGAGLAGAGLYRFGRKRHAGR